jgi:hypothetical protein
MRYLIIILLFFSCAPQKEVTKTHFVSDTLITHTVETVTLPTKNITILDSPCKNDSLTISDQTIKTGKTTLTIKESQGNLIIEQSTDTIKEINTSETKKHSEKQAETIIITKTKTPKWAWWLVGLTSLYIAYRILRIQFPLIRFLPY